MPKTSSLQNMARGCAAGLLIPSYVVLGIGLIPTSTLLPEMGSVQNVAISECHKSCHVAKGKEYCSYKCSYKDTPKKTVKPIK